MTYIDDINIIYNLQYWFRKNRIDDLDNNDKVWAENFKQWLAEQGCEIDYANNRVLRNSLGIAPNYDKLRFANSKDATIFVLRWS
jgi:hypothetical protein